MKTTPGGPPEKGAGFTLHYGWIVVFTGMLATIGAHGFGRMAYTLVLPEMQAALGLSNTQSGLLATGNFIGYLFFALVGGFMAARYGSRIVISLSLLLMGITMLLTGAANSFEMAFAMRLLTGLGNGSSYVPAMALGSMWFTASRRGFATGIVSGGIGVGTLIAGLIVPPILLSHGGQGWSYAWYTLGGLVLIIAAVSFIFLRNRPEEMGLKAVGAGNASPSEQGGTKAGSTILQWDLVYRLKEVWHLGLVYFAYGFSYVIYMTFFKKFLIAEVAFSDVRASAAWALAGGLSVFCGVIWGGISDRLGRKYGAALAYLTLAASYLIFAAFHSTFAIYFSVVLFGLSAWSIPTIMAAAVGDHVGPRLAPAGVGFITLFFGIGQALGPALAGYIADLMETFIYAFFLAAGVSLLGLAGSMFMKRPAARKSPQSQTRPG